MQRDLAIFFWIMHYNAREKKWYVVVHHTCYFLLNYAEKLEPYIVHVVLTCYFLLNYASARIRWYERRHCVDDNLLFSFELCVADATGTLVDDTRVQNLLFSFELCTNLYMLCTMPANKMLLLFSFELCLAALVVALQPAVYPAACYFLLNYAYGNLSIIDPATKPSCYFLLNYARCRPIHLQGDKPVLSCYFLLNYAHRSCLSSSKVRDTQVLLFSFELCGSPVYCYCASSINLLFSFELCTNSTSFLKPPSSNPPSCYFLLNYA